MQNNKYMQYGDLFELEVTLQELYKQSSCIEKDIVIAFLERHHAFSFQVKKRIMQCLRKYDHIKNCFELWEALEHMTEYDYFFLFDIDDNIFPPCNLDLIYTIEELIR